MVDFLSQMFYHYLMTNYFNSLGGRTKFVILVLSVFLLSLSVGLLVLGTDLEANMLSTDILNQSAEQLHFLP